MVLVYYRFLGEEAQAAERIASLEESVKKFALELEEQMQIQPSAEQEGSAAETALPIALTLTIFAKPSNGTL